MKNVHKIQQALNKLGKLKIGTPKVNDVVPYSFYNGKIANHEQTWGSNRNTTVSIELVTKSRLPCQGPFEIRCLLHRIWKLVLPMQEVTYNNSADLLGHRLAARSELKI